MSPTSAARAHASVVHVVRRIHRLEGQASQPDDLMTQLLNVEFEDEDGATRRLTREELLTFLILIASAGNDTTNRLIGWIGKVLGDNPRPAAAAQ